MAEKMLVTQALDERDLLEKKIKDKIKKASFVDYAKNNEEKVFNCRITKEDYDRKAKAAYQQIMDLIARYQKVDAAIIKSNAETYVETSFGIYSVATAIAMRNRLRSAGTGDSADFPYILLEKLADEYQEVIKDIDVKNSQLQATAENMRLSILGKDSKVKEEQPLKVVTEFIKENTAELVDPIDIKKIMVEINDKHDALLSELDTKIKVANATTFIEI